MLEDFLNHKLLIRITGATIDDLKELDKVIGLPYMSGDRLYEKYTNTSAERYLHHRTNRTDRDGLSFSDNPVDVFDGDRPIPFINYYELFESNFKLFETDELLNMLLE